MIELNVLASVGRQDALDKSPLALSPRESEIVARAGEGATDREIADELGLSVATLRTYWTRVRDKLGAVNRTHAITLAMVDRPRLESTDVRARLVDSLVRDCLASWVWRPRSRHALLDDLGARFFGLPEGGCPVPMEKLLAHIWSPDRARFERFLQQGGDLRPMTPIELRVGMPGDYRNLIRTVNLASGTGADPALLLTSTVLHVFK